MLANYLNDKAPSVLWDWRRARWRVAPSEPEIRLLSLLCNPAQTSVDVGSAKGEYAVAMAACSSRVIAFEARPDAAEVLGRNARATGYAIEVRNMALSDFDGVATLKIPKISVYLSSIESRDDLGDDAEVLKIPAGRLDSLDLGPVGLIKIDVEGHELSVLRGCTATIQMYRPNLIVESEDRHRKNAVADLFAFAREIGYVGYFLEGKQLKRIESFDASLHQDHDKIGANGHRTGGVYINNFIFVHRDKADTRSALEKMG